MASRSGRQHKPTSKFLNFYSEELSPPHRHTKKKDFAPKKTGSTTSKTTQSAPNLPGNELTRSLVLRKNIIAPTKQHVTPAKIPSFPVKCAPDKSVPVKSIPVKSVPVKSIPVKSVPVRSPPIIPLVRKSGRKQQPSQKLKEYIHAPIVQFKDNESFSGFEIDPDDALSPFRAAQLKSAKVQISRVKPASNSHQSRREYVYKVEDYETFSDVESESSIPATSKARVLNKNARSGMKSVAAITPMIRKDGIGPSFKNEKDLSVRLIDCFEELTNDLALHHPTSSSVSKIQSSGSPASKRGCKRPVSDDSRGIALNKQPRLSSTVVRSLTKTKKPTSTPRQLQTEIVIPKEKPQPVKVQKRHAARQTVVPSNEVVEAAAASSSDDDIYVTQHLIVAEPPKKDIRETLKKFLIMGSKVANAISETLKHNEEALLSQSSAFEKKCLSLVHALAKQGSDLEEEDMEKVLKLLDEEQEERKAYRHTFLESLRVSHLTNMALYSQMLRLLKTL